MVGTSVAADDDVGVRVTLTAYSGQRDRTYRGPAELRSEDHEVRVPEPGALATGIPDRSFRRRQLRTVVHPRDLT